MTDAPTENQSSHLPIGIDVFGGKREIARPQPAHRLHIATGDASCIRAVPEVILIIERDLGNAIAALPQSATDTTALIERISLVEKWIAKPPPIIPCYQKFNNRHVLVYIR